MGKNSGMRPADLPGAIDDASPIHARHAIACRIQPALARAVLAL
jgi:hypothetical protein